MSPVHSFSARFRFTTLCLVALAVSAHGEGFRNPTAGSLGLGQSGGRRVHVDDASAVVHNPANLLGIAEPEVQVAPSVVYYRVEFESTFGQDETRNPWHVLPNVFASLPLVTNSMALGLGVTTPYGLGSEWEQSASSPLRYVAPYKTDLKTVNVGASLAVRLAPGLTLGGGLDVMWSELEFKQHYPWLLFPGSTGLEPDGDFRLKGDGLGFGGNVGISWELLEGHTLAATYRSPVGIRYDGGTELSNITPVAQALGATATGPFRTRIEFPTIVGAGYGVKVSDRVRLEVNGEWLEFSRFDALRVDAGNNAFLLPTTEVRQDWKDTFTVGVGGDWRFADHWLLRAGYQYFESPVPDETLSPSIPDANQHVVTAGLAWRYRGHALEASYGYDWYDRREVSNNQVAAFNGRYDITVHMLAFAYRFRF